jgi:hypothetical protein
LEIIAKQATAFAALVAGGADIEGAALAVGMDEDTAALLVPEFTGGPGLDANGNPLPATTDANGNPIGAPATDPNAAPGATPTGVPKPAGKRRRPPSPRRGANSAGKQTAKPGSAGGTGGDASGDSSLGLPADQGAG